MGAALCEGRGLEVANALCWWEAVNITLLNALPGEVIIEVPISINNSIISLDVSKEAFVIEYTVDSAVEPVHSRVILFELGPC